MSQSVYDTLVNAGWEHVDGSDLIEGDRVFWGSVGEGCVTTVARTSIFVKNSRFGEPDEHPIHVGWLRAPRPDPTPAVGMVARIEHVTYGERTAVFLDYMTKNGNVYGADHWRCVYGFLQFMPDEVKILEVLYNPEEDK